MARPKTFNHEIRQKLCFEYVATIRRHFGVETLIETPPLEFKTQSVEVETIHGKASTSFSCTPTFLHVYFQFHGHPDEADLPISLAKFNPYSYKWNSWAEPGEDPLASGQSVTEDFERRMAAISAANFLSVSFTRKEGEKLRDAIADAIFTVPVDKEEALRSFFEKLGNCLNDGPGRNR